MRTYRDIINLWPSCADLERELGLSGRHSGLRVRAWRMRNSIPPEHWTALIEAARARDLSVSLEELAGIAALSRTDAVQAAA